MFVIEHDGEFSHLIITIHTFLEIISNIPKRYS